MKSPHCITYQSDQVPQLSFVEKLPGEKSLIQIHFWEAYILKRKVAAKFLADCPYDVGQAYSDHVDMQQICYRFTNDVWFSKIKLRQRINLTELSN